MFKATFLLLLLILYGSSATAQPSRDMEREKAIVAELENSSPASVADFKAGTEAMDAQDYNKAVELFQAAYRKAPHSDAVLRRLGGCLVLTGKPDEGFPLLEQALAIRHSPENLISLAQALAYPGEGKQATREQKLRAFSLIKEANRSPQRPNDPDFLLVQAQLAMELDKVDDFRAATEQLVAKYPNLMPTHFYSAVLAASDERWTTAEHEIKVAQSLGLPAEVAQEFLDSGVHTRATVWHYFFYSLYLVGAWIVGLLALFLIGKLMSRKTLRSLEEANPNNPTSAAELTLRKWYRRLINVAGFYYYISLPVVIVLVVVVAVSVTYACIMLGRIPIK